jgi:uncharacterized protein (DUF305 family)
MPAYLRLAAMTALSFIAMYILMYAMVNSIDNVYNSLNEVYMAGLMAAPMIAISLAVMGHMYPSRRVNVALAVLSIVALAGFWALIRVQGAVGDRQFVRSMIPHHAGAILMCRKAPIADAELKDLCKQIISSQQREIDQMKGILSRLER